MQFFQNTFRILILSVKNEKICFFIISQCANENSTSHNIFPIESYIENDKMIFIFQLYLTKQLNDSVLLKTSIRYQEYTIGILIIPLRVKKISTLCVKTPDLSNIILLKNSKYFFSLFKTLLKMEDF